MRNDYGQLLEPWKVDLILDRAKKKGFRAHELEDVQQEVVQAVLGFRFLPEKSNGATEATVLTALIDNQLAALHRSRARLHKREEKYRQLHGVRDGKPAEEAQVPAPDDALCLSLDVRSAIADLTPQQQSVCAALARGDSRSAIAKAMKISRYEVDRLLEAIREHFKALGLDACGGGQ